MPLPITETQLTHYDVLRVPVQASVDAIRSSFKSLSLSCHPDKLKRIAANSTPSSKRKQEAAQVAAREQWRRIEEAHEVLSEPLARLMYDIEVGIVPDTHEAQERIQRLKRKDAQRAVATMEETVAAMRAKEEAEEGLLIVKARWGDLSVPEEEAARAVTAPYIDVSVPLQYHVDPHSHSIEIHAGSSCTWLEGFYDPSLGANPEANKLYVKYKFLNAMHEAWFDDQEAVRIPLPEHLMAEQPEDAAAAAAEAEAEIDAPIATAALSSNVNLGRASKRFSAAAPSATRGSRASVAAAATSRSTQLAQQKARRRLLLYTVLAGVGVGFYLYRSRNSAQMMAARQMASGAAQAVQRFIAAQMQRASAAMWQSKSVSSASASSSSSAPAPTPVLAAPVVVAPLYVAPSLPLEPSVSAAASQ